MTIAAAERDQAVVSLSGVTKRFEGVVALSDVSLELGAGEVLVLLGENGAGKSTLVNVLIGALQPDEGEIRVRGEAVRHQDPAAARQQGINAVLQDFSLAPSLSVADNLYLGREPERFGLRDRARIQSDARRARPPSSPLGRGRRCRRSRPRGLRAKRPRPGRRAW